MYVSEKIDQMIQAGQTFTADACGESCKLFFPNMPKDYQKSKYYGDGMVMRKGSHLNRMVLIEVKKRIEDGLYTPPTYKEDELVNVNFVALANLQKKFSDKCLAVDINSCYWTTAYNIGVISEQLYRYGIDENIEKTTRNSSIGSLGAYTRHVEVKKGEIISDISKRRDTHPARTDVIKSVWDVALEVYRELGDDCLMFLTDCFFITESGYNKLSEILTKYGYDHKSDDIVFTAVDDTHRLDLEWMAIKGEEIKYKTIIFNQSQYISNILSHDKERE